MLFTRWSTIFREAKLSKHLNRSILFGINSLALFNITRTEKRLTTNNLCMNKATQFKHTQKTQKMIDIKSTCRCHLPNSILCIRSMFSTMEESTEWLTQNFTAPETLFPLVLSNVCSQLYEQCSITQFFLFFKNIVGIGSERPAPISLLFVSCKAALEEKSLSFKIFSKWKCLLYILNVDY